MTRQRAVSQLGPWSSHPSALKVRQRRWAMIGGGPAALSVVGLLLWWRFGGLSLLGLIQDWATWLPLVLGLVAFGCSMVLTVSLTLRGSAMPVAQQLPKGGRATKVAPWVIGTILLSLGAFVLTRGGFLGGAFGGDSMATVRLVGHLVGSLPMLLLMLWVNWCAVPVDEWGTAEAPATRGRWELFWRVWNLLWQMGLYVSVMVTIDRVAYWVDQYEASLRRAPSPAEDGVIPGLLRWVPGLGDRVDLNLGLADFIAGGRDWICAVVVLGGLVMLVTFMIRELFATLLMPSATERPVEPRRVIEQQGFLRTPAGETWGLPEGRARPGRSGRLLWEPIPAGEEPGSSQKVEEQREAAGGPPEWFRRLRASAAIDADWAEAQRVRPGETSEPAGREDLAPLFPSRGAGGGPTQDQVAALEEFDRIFERFLESEDREQKHILPALDLLVTGPPGSGKTSLLLACAMHAVVLRGQSVLIFVNSPEKARLFVTRLRMLAANCGVGWHVAVGELNKNDVVAWSDPLDSQPVAKGKRLHRSPIGSLPDIHVGTPNDYERLLYGADHGGTMVRRALLRMQAVMIEDLTAFSAEERRHLPFLLEKHRLILRSEQVPTQFLALAPDLTDQLATQLGNRLFSERERTHHLRLRPPEREAPWVVDLAADAPGEAAEQLSAAAGEASIDAVLWRPGASPQDRARLQQRLNVRVIADVDELDVDDERAAALAVYRSNTTRRSTQALCARIQGEDAVIVRVTTPSGAAPQHEPRWALPVLPSVESEALSVAHLKSAARFLAAWTPIPRDSWARLGLRAAGLLSPAAGGPDARFEPVPDYSLVFDPPEAEVERGAVAARGQSWPWVAVQTAADRDDARALPMPPPRDVKVTHPLGRGEASQLDEAGARMQLGRRETDEHAIASWLANDGQGLHKMDLAYTDRLLHFHGENTYWPETIEPGGGDGEAVVVRGKHYEDKGAGEAFLPVWDMEVRVPAGVELTFSQGSAVGDLLRWATLIDSRRGAAQPVAARFWLSGTFDELGSRAPIDPPLQIQYGARVGLLRLGPVDDAALGERETAAEALAACLRGVWSTNGELSRSDSVGAPWPTLGMAVTAALRESLPGLFEYVRLAAFHGPKGTAFAGCALLLFVEPVGTRGTARDAVERLLGALEMLDELSGYAASRLREVRAFAGGAGVEALQIELEMLAVEAGVQVGDCDADERTFEELDLAISLLEQLADGVDERQQRLSARRGRGRRASRRDGGEPS